MRYHATTRFNRSVERLDPVRKTSVKAAIDRLVAGFETGDIPQGLGLKHLRSQVWELRAGLGDRVIFHRAGDVVEFLLAGDHNEIKRFLRSR